VRACRAHHDEDTPGFGKYYCIPCAKYCQNAAALVDHEKSKPHKRRVKMLMNTPRPHNQVDADIASGMGPPDNGPKLRSGGGAALMAE
jgi:bud site selection protein 20